MRIWIKRLALAAVVIATALAPALARQAYAAEASTSDAFERACIDLMRGKPPSTGQAAEALREACASLMKARTEAEQQRQAAAQLRQQQQEQQARVAAGVSTAQPQPGENALAAFGVAGSELVGSRPRGTIGFRGNGEPFANTVTTNPIGWFTGQGINAELAHSFQPQFSWTVGVHYSQESGIERSVYTLGALGGIDWFLFGRNNEGFRIGPRLDFSFGRESSTGTATSSRLGLAGEVGYNFIATNGVTGSAAFGVGGRISGDKNEQLSSAVGGELGPYVKLGIGFSW